MILKFVSFFFAFYGLCAERPQVTVIFKHLGGPGDISSSSLRRNQGLASRKKPSVGGCLTSSISALSAGGQAFTPGEQGNHCPEAERKGQRDGP